MVIIKIPETPTNLKSSKEIYNCGYKTNTISKGLWMYSQIEIVNCTQNI